MEENGVVVNEPKPLIVLKNLTKAFANNLVLKGIDLTIYENEFVTLLGPSGCGKTTTLRIIGGFEKQTSGQVLFAGKEISHIPSYRRPTNTVFQRYALFPHLSVFENVAFGRRNYFNNKANVEAKLEEVLGRFLTAFLADENTKLPYNIRFAKPDSRLRLGKLILQYQISDIKSLKRTIIVGGKSVDGIKYFRSLFTIKEKSLIELIISEEVTRLLKLVNLDGYSQRGVTKLSGGQQQRVAIARALINQPRVLLLDEPLGALDLKLRQEMQYELKEIQRKTGITFIYVTHDQEEALTMSDKIVIMNDGVILQIGTPQEVYNDPINRFVAKFIGESNIIEGVFVDDETVMFDDKRIKVEDSMFEKDALVDVVIRPEDLEIVYPSKGRLTGVVDSVVFKGVYYETNVMTDRREYTVHTTKYYPVGRQVGLNFTSEDIHVMERERQ